MSELSGEELIAQNMAALDSGEDLPHEEAGFDGSEEIADELDEPIEEEGAHEEDYDNNSDDDARHMSKEDWVASGRDEDAYLSQDEFKRAGDLKEESSLQLAKKLAQQESMMQEILGNQNKAIKEAEERAIAKLKEEQKEAIEYDNTAEAVKLEREIAEREANKPEDKEPVQNVDIRTFYDANKYWYGKAPAATEMFDVLMGREEAKGVGFSDALSSVTEKVKVKFDYLFDDAAPAKKEPVAKKPLVRPRAISEKSRTPVKKAGKTRSFSELDQGMQKIARKMAKSTGQSEHDYVTQILGE